LGWSHFWQEDPQRFVDEFWGLFEKAFQVGSAEAGQDVKREEASMAGQTYSPLQPGDRCIIHVNDVNSPTGWWWGIVDSFEWKGSTADRWGCVTATITGPFGFEPGSPLNPPAFGSMQVKPSVNYNVYAADRAAIDLVRQLRQAQDTAFKETRDLHTRLDELRSILKSMGMQPEQLRQILKETVDSSLEALYARPSGG
jgi:hypothetical protein